MVEDKSHKMKKNKKAQMKIQQMAFLLIAVTLFFIIAGLFFLMIGFSNLKSSSSLLNENNALTLASKIADSPEFSCGDAFGQSRSNCIDMDKLMALKSELGRYSDFWGISGIEVQKVYPAGQDVECTLDNYPDCNKITVMALNGSGTGLANFVSLCRKGYDNLLYDKCELGRVVVFYNG